MKLQKTGKGTYKFIGDLAKEAKPPKAQNMSRAPYVFNKPINTWEDDISGYVRQVFPPKNPNTIHYRAANAKANLRKAMQLDHETKEEKLRDADEAARAARVLGTRQRFPSISKYKPITRK